MQPLREARLSLRKAIETIFTTGSLVGGTAYNVYGESELTGNGQNIRPFLYIIDSRIMFPSTALPLMVLETDMEMVGFELGTHGHDICRANIHVFGRNRGERDDLSYLVMKNIQSMDIYDFDTNAPTFLRTMPLYPIRVGPLGDVYWDSQDITIGQAEMVENTLLNWKMLSCMFWIFST